MQLPNIGINDTNMKLQDTYQELIKESVGLKPTLSKDDVDPKELAVGVEVELEHSTDIEVRTKIALHHLGEDPKYYTKLLNSGLVDEPVAKRLGNELGMVENSDMSKGGLVKFDDCTKLNNNKEAQNGGCSVGDDDVISIEEI